MESIVVARYELTVFDNGNRIELKRLDTSVVDDYSSCSSRIKQILLVVKEIRRYSLSNVDISDLEIYTHSIANVAASLGVEQTTISDKITRQLGKNTKVADIQAIENIII